MTSRGSGLLSALFGAALFASAGAALAQEAWHTMTGPEKSFTADLPAEPKYTTAQSSTPAGVAYTCLLYTSPSPRDGLLSRMPSSA